MNSLTKKMRTFFRTTIKIVALRQIKARARTWISGHVFPISAFSEHQTYRQSPGVISLKRCFLPKNWGPHFAKKKNSSPYNSNYFIILPNNSNKVSLKLNSSETKFVWSNLKRGETCYVTSARTKTYFSHQLNSKIIQRRKSLRHVATVANFLMTTNLKRHSKSEYALSQTSSILFNFI